MRNVEGSVQRADDVAPSSINDTVVIYDRIRENLRKYKAMPLPDLFGVVALFAVVAGAILFALVPWMKRLMGEVN